MLELLPFSLLMPFGAATVVPILYGLLGRRIGWAVLAVPSLLFLYFTSFLGTVGAEGLRHSWAWVPSLGIQLTLGLDGLSLLFALLITGIGALVVFYSIYYLGAREDLAKFYIYILLFMGAMIGVVLSENLAVLYVSWELTSVSSFLLIGFWHARPESRDGALKSLLVTVLGGLALLAGFVLLFVAGGSYDFRELLDNRSEIVASPLYVPAVLLIFLGAFTKSAQVPFHIWLPAAMAAPTPVSAYLHSATMVKAGIFLIAKMSLLLGGTALWYYGVAGAGAITVAFAAVLAIRQVDLKALLAFSTVSQLGLIMPMFAIGSEVSALAGAAHIINHATFKGALFLLVGIIDHETHTRNIDRLGGLFRRMPITSALIIIAALSMAGMWPLNGFVSKELIFEALLHPPVGPNLWTWGFAILAVLGSVFTTAYSLILAHRILFMPPSRVEDDVASPRDDSLEHAHDPPIAMLIGPILLCGLVVLLGVYPFPFETPLYQAAAGAVLGHASHAHLHNLPIPGAPLYMSLIALGFGALVYLQRDRIRLLLDRTPKSWSANAVYEGILKALQHGSERLNRGHMTGFLRDYILFTLGAAVLLVGFGVLRTLIGGVRFDLAPVAIWESVLLVMIAVGSFLVILFKRRLAAIIALGSVGASISLLFVFMQAPDLALTQLMVEAISTVLILLVFAHLPIMKREDTTRTHRGMNLAVAIASGVLVASLAAVAIGNVTFEGIGRYFVENSLPLGGGANIVNVILVDFRGLDTMGEITVLAIAALSVRALVRLRPQLGRERESPDADPEGGAQT